MKEIIRKEDGAGGLLDKIFGVSSYIIEWRDENNHIFAIGAGYAIEEARKDIQDFLDFIKPP